MCRSCVCFYLFTWFRGQSWTAYGYVGLCTQQYTLQICFLIVVASIILCGMQKRKYQVTQHPSVEIYNYPILNYVVVHRAQN